MVTVEISFPALKRNYEFNLSENEAISVLTVEIVEMISQNERITMSDNLDDMVMCDLAAGKIFSNSACLADYGVKNGAKLMLL